MLTVRLADRVGPIGALALPVRDGEVPATTVALPERLGEECAALWRQDVHSSRAGQVVRLPRPLDTPGVVLLADVGEGDEAGWRAAGAALARVAVREETLAVAVPPGTTPEAVAGLTEGLRLASYRYRLADDDPATAPHLAEVTVVVDDPDRYAEAVRVADVVTEATGWARDWTNTPSLEKSPEWLAAQVQRQAATVPGLRCRVWGTDELRAEGFGGVLAVGGGSVRPPRLVELAWQPDDAALHVVLVGKGITFDTGGLSLKPSEAMTLMRKDMGGAASVLATTLAVAKLGLPVRVTALAPLAENMPSGSAVRPGDVVRHFGGRTSEVDNTDAEGRLVLADALAYAAERLRPDRLVDLATLTRASAVALGERIAALYSDNDALAAELAAAADAAGERVWRMPLPEDYREELRSEVADLTNSPGGGAGSVMAALYLREFTGDARDRWAHVDMSAQAWSNRDRGELSRGATGWGVRTLVRWLRALG